MIRSFGCSWLSGQPWTTASSDHVRRRSGGRGGSGAIVSIGSVWSGTRPVGAPFPARAAGRPPRDPGLARVPAGSPRPRRLVGVAGLGALPDPGVAWAAVPDWGARLFGTRPPPVWVPRNRLWSRPSTPQPSPGCSRRTPLGQGRGPVHDQQERGTSCRGAAQVPIPLITPQLPGAARRRGSGPQPVAWHPNCGGLVVNGRAPQSGTAARATT
jgi:hypothetical protein